jgi:hypothetical protein
MAAPGPPQGVEARDVVGVTMGPHFGSMSPGYLQRRFYRRGTRKGTANTTAESTAKGTAAVEKVVPVFNRSVIKTSLQHNGLR